MQTEQTLTFGSYRFEPHTRQLWRGTQEVRLTGKATAVLRLLLERSGQVVTKDELFHTVWPDTVVSDAALTSCIQELRQALHDNARKPRYIETVHRRGFRLLEKVGSSEGSEQRAGSKEQRGKSLFASLVSHARSPTPSFVGRDSDLAFLHERFAKASGSERQLLFVTGEPGIGKTTLVDVFVSDIHKQPESSVAASLLHASRSQISTPWLSGAMH